MIYRKTSLFIITILIPILVLACLPRQGPAPSRATFGALLPLGGDLATVGESTMAGVELAATDINTHLNDVGSWLRISVHIENTRAEPGVALESTKSFARRSGRVLIGPHSSSEVKAIKDFVNQNGLIALAYASSAPSLAIADNIFRLVPDDTYQAQVITRLMSQDKIKAILPVWRSDVWGDDLVAAVKTRFESLGGRVLEGVRYDPAAKSFAPDVLNLNTRLNRAVPQYGASGVAIYYVSLREANALLAEASKYQDLAGVRWYGSDGTAADSGIIKNETTGRFAAATRMTNPVFAEPEDNEQMTRVKGLLREKLKREPDESALYAYDAVWIAALSHLSTGPTNDPNLLRKAIIQSASSYYGITGWTALNEAGDRRFAHYNLWTVTKDGNSYRWQKTGGMTAGPP